MDTNAPLVVDPVDDRLTEELDVMFEPQVFVLSDMPVTKRVDRVTLGEFARGSDCTADPVLRLTVHAHDGGDLSKVMQVGYASTQPRIGTTPSRVTWTLAPGPITFKRGTTYTFKVSYGDNPSGCRKLKQTTWAHNSSQVNGGRAACTVGPTVGPYADFLGGRAWHAAGQQDNSCNTTNFNPGMPEGWLAIHQPGCCPLVRTGMGDDADPCYERTALKPAEYGAVRAGPWTVNGTPYYACKWPQFRAPNDPDNQHGWYYATPWPKTRNGTPRDMYLKLDTIDYDALLRQHVPELRYDNDELFHPLAASSITDFFVDNDQARDSNSLKNPDPNPGDPEDGVFAVANTKLIPPFGMNAFDQLGLGYLGSRYPSGGAGHRAGTLARSADFLSERSSGSHGSYQEDSRALQGDPSGRYFGRIYGRAVHDSDGRVWLQYWRFYYYNDAGSGDVGVHEGDWESIQVRLNAAMQPELISFEAHNGEETCRWADAETSYGHPIAYIAAGTHAAYSHAGTYRLGEAAQGDGLWLAAPTVEPITVETPWVGWPGRWGDSGDGGPFGGESPRFPAQQSPNSKWSDPDEWIGQIDDCDMSPPP